MLWRSVSRCHPQQHCLLQKVKQRAEPIKVEVPLSGRFAASPHHESWFGTVASIEPRTALGVLQLAESFSIDVKPGEWSQARPTLAIIPTQSGKLVTAAEVVLAPDGVSVPDRESVAAELQSNAEARRLLKSVLHVNELDDQVWGSILSRHLGGAGRQAKEPTRRVGRHSGLGCALRRRELQGLPRTRAKMSVRVRRRDGRWVKGDSVLLPGGLVSDGDPSPNSNVLIDSDAHGERSAIVSGAGRRGCSGRRHRAHGLRMRSRRETKALAPWLHVCRRRYKGTHENSALGAYLEPETFIDAARLTACLRSSAALRRHASLPGSWLVSPSRVPMIRLDLATSTTAVATPEDRRAAPAALVRAQPWRSARWALPRHPSGHLSRMRRPVSLANTCRTGVASNPRSAD
jgi:hypothetical protein